MAVSIKAGGVILPIGAFELRMTKKPMYKAGSSILRLGVRSQYPRSKSVGYRRIYGICLVIYTSPVDI
jgi:hypothetical protein